MPNPNPNPNPTPNQDRLPSAHTCFNHLLLPEYQSLEHTQKQLVKAIQDTEGFHIV